MIDVNDFGEVGRPVCAAITGTVTAPPEGLLAAGQHGCNRGKEIASMKAGREALWFPVDLKRARLERATLDQLEQAVGGADIPPAVSLENNGRPRSADAGINDAEKNGPLGKPRA